MSRPNGAANPGPRSSHLEPYGHKPLPVSFSGRDSARSTPGIAGDISARLNLDSTTDDDDDVDSLDDETSGTSSDEEEIFYKEPLRELPTGLCYDDRMRYHAEVASTIENSIHPEDPRRIYYIFKELSDAGLVFDGRSKRPLVRQPLRRIDAREATREECCLVHTQEHYDFVESTAGMSFLSSDGKCVILTLETADMTDEQLIEKSDDNNMDSIYFNKLSYFCSKLSAGGAIETCRAVVDRKVKNAIAIIRPPGHHAEVNKTMGFCLFNNVCIASKVCQAQFGPTCRKILVLDW